jgi:hypothetical protein
MAWLHKIQDSHDVVVEFVEYFDMQYEDGRKEIKLSGKIEDNSARLPGEFEYRYRQLQEIEAVLEYLNIELRSVRSRFYRSYLETYKRSLTSRDIDKYIDGEEEVIGLQLLINEVALVRNKFLALTKGFESKGFQLMNLVKLRTAGIEDAIV